jgi:RimJ/RimL family protein N-acetyltransferase
MRLREVEDRDLDALFGHQADPEAYELADVPTRDRAAFDAHWAQIRRSPQVVIRTIEVDGQVAGHVLSWLRDDGVRLVGYWIGRELWGRGIASAALAEFLTIVDEGPLQATIAPPNTASRRVLEKNGFRLLREEPDSLVFELARS